MSLLPLEHLWRLSGRDTADGSIAFVRRRLLPTNGIDPGGATGGAALVCQMDVADRQVLLVQSIYIEAICPTDAMLAHVQYVGLIDVAVQTTTTGQTHIINRMYGRGSAVTAAGATDPNTMVLGDRQRALLTTAGVEDRRVQHWPTRLLSMRLQPELWVPSDYSLVCRGLYFGAGALPLTAQTGTSLSVDVIGYTMPLGSLQR